MRASHIRIKIYGRVDKANSQIFQFNFAGFHFIVIFFSIPFICIVAYFTVKNLLFVLSFRRYHVL